MNRTNCSINISGKTPPTPGGAWGTTRYDKNKFIKKSKCIGITYISQKGGHFKAVLVNDSISDAVTTSLHNTTTDAAKDIARYVTKYLIIKIGYSVLGMEFVQNKCFSYHEEKLFKKDNDIEFDTILNGKGTINRNEIMFYVKKCFVKGDKIDTKEAMKALLVTGG